MGFPGLLSAFEGMNSINIGGSLVASLYMDLESWMEMWSKLT